MDTLTTLQQNIAITVDQSTDTPTIGGAEWELRRFYINRALKEWSEAYNWESLRRTTWLSTPQGSTVSLPADFKKMAAYPVLYSPQYTSGQQWPEIQPNEIMQHDSTEQYFYVLGNFAEGKSMIWNPGTLASGSSLFIQYYSVATSLASPGSISQCPDPEFIIDKAIALLYQSRNDQRFQLMETKARERLLQMIDNENEKSRAYTNRIETPERLYYGFRVGRD